MFEIKNNVPPPAGRSKYPFDAMKAGDHFDAPRDMGKAKSGLDARQNSIRSSVHAYVRRYNPSAKYTVRLVDENTVRCWRTD